MWALVRRKSGYVLPDGMSEISFALLMAGSHCHARPIPLMPARLPCLRALTSRDLRRSAELRRSAGQRDGDASPSASSPLPGMQRDLVRRVPFLASRAGRSLHLAPL